MFRGKKYQDAAKQIEKNTQYDAAEGFGLICKTASAKFDETVELHVKLGVDSRHADQQVRGAIVLPNGTGKTAAFSSSPRATRRTLPGSRRRLRRRDGSRREDPEGKLVRFRRRRRFPDMMGVVGRLGKVLGPKGLMPSPKAGTVTPDVAKAVKESRPVRSSTVSTRPTSSTAPSARSPSVPRSSPRTSTLSWALSSRPSPPPPRASISSPASPPPPWAPASR